MQNKLLNRSQFQGGIKSPYFDLPAMAVCRCQKCQNGSRAGRITILILKIMHVDAYILQPYIGSSMLALTAFVAGGSLVELATTITVSYPNPFTQDSLNAALEAAVNTYASGQGYIVDNLFGIRSSKQKFFKASVAGGAGVATFYTDTNGDGTGTALYANLTADMLSFFVDGVADQYAFPTITVAGNKKSVTVLTQKLGFSGVTILGINALGTVAYANAANGVAVKMIIGIDD